MIDNYKDFTETLLNDMDWFNKLPWYKKMFFNFDLKLKVLYKDILLND